MLGFHALPVPAVEPEDTANAIAFLMQSLQVGKGLAPKGISFASPHVTRPTRCIAFLASDKARYVSGLVLDVAAGGNARYTA